MTALLKRTVGFGNAFIYCLLTAFSTLYIARIDNLIDPVLSMLITFFISALWFNVINARSVIRIHQACWAAKKHWLSLNLSTLVTWVGTFFALKYITPVLFIALFMGFSPFFTYLFSVFLRQVTCDKKHVILGVLIILLLGLLVIESARHTNVQLHLLGRGCLFSMLGAAGGGWYLIQAKAIQDHCRFSSSQVLAVRFYALLLGAAGVVFFTHAYTALPQSLIFALIGLAVVMCILPLYCMQVSLNHIGPVRFSFLLPFTPVFTDILWWFSGSRFDWGNAVLVLILTLVLLYYTFSKHKPKT